MAELLKENTMKDRKERLEGQMSFLEHLDEFRRRLVRSVLMIGLAFLICWFFSDSIYNFLAIPGQRALTNAQRNAAPLEGKTGVVNTKPLSDLKDGQVGTYIFSRITNFRDIPIAAGTSVLVKVNKNKDGKIDLYTESPIFTSGKILPAGVKIPVDLTIDANLSGDASERMVITTPTEPFTLKVTVSLYAAIAFTVPFLLLEIWGFVAPALYKHERRYVTPFLFLSTISFVIGAAFAYYILFPPAIGYLLSLGSDFQLLLRATDYFEFVTLIMLAMGIIFQMPAISYVLSRIGVISAGLLIKGWKIAVVVIMIVAAFISPTGDIPNMMLFATPMLVLYVVSIVIAWGFGSRQKTDETT
jgi:sec-independent protein translocase protein TatC